MAIVYKIKTASEKEILHHLELCNDNFIPPLNKKVNLNDYSKKLFDNSVTLEAWDDEKLAGLIAAYFNDSEKKTGYITNVSVLNEFAGKGIASELLRQTINYAVKNNYSRIKLEVAALNNNALKLYRKFNFNEIAKGEITTMELSLKKTLQS